jgi:hypothetical protein
LILKREEKEKLVIQLAEAGKSTRHIAQVVHISLKDIGTIIRKHTGEDSACKDNSQSIYSRAFRLFKEGKTLVDIAINLDIETDEVLRMYSDYLRLLNLQRLMAIYKEMGDDIYLLEHLYHELQNEGLANKQDIFNIVQMEGKLKSLNCELYETAGEIGRLNSAKFQLERDVDDLTRKIDDYDAILLERSQQARRF